MGSVFGGFLFEGALDVILVDVWQEHVKAINQNGLRIIGYGGDHIVPIRALTEAGPRKPVDVVLVQCKATATRAAVSAAQGQFGDSTVAVSFQNGLGNEETIAEIIGPQRVLGGATRKAQVSWKQVWSEITVTWPFDRGDEWRSLGPYYSHCGRIYGSRFENSGIREHPICNLEKTVCECCGRADLRCRALDDQWNESSSRAMGCCTCRAR